ncbi:hypothetical protein O6P43_017379, partial [Quillaja saponaria]
VENLNTICIFVTSKMELKTKSYAVDAHYSQESPHVNWVCLQGWLGLVLILNLKDANQQWIQKYEDSMTWY